MAPPPAFGRPLARALAASLLLAGAGASWAAGPRATAAGEAVPAAGARFSAVVPSLPAALPRGLPAALSVPAVAIPQAPLAQGAAPAISGVAAAPSAAPAALPAAPAIAAGWDLRRAAAISIPGSAAEAGKTGVPAASGRAEAEAAKARGTEESRDAQEPRALFRARRGWEALVGRSGPRELSHAVDAALPSSGSRPAASRLGRALLRAAPAAVLLAVPAAAHAAGTAASAPSGMAVPGLLTALALGFGLGMRHATDSDHVVAVATLVARTKRAGTAWLLGAFWGLGHTATIFLVGLGIIVFKLEIPVRLGLAMEFSVGIVLAALGLANIMRRRVHALAHEHGVAHGAWKRVLAGAGKGQLLRSTFVGLVHGLAGSAAVALLVMAAMPTPAQALAYLGVFGAGTLAGMLLISAFMESAMAFLARRGRALGPWLAVGTGVLSLAFGLWVVWHIGFVDGLFLAHPHWTPK